ncbi:hypothetical protein ABVG11_26680 [Streptomyces sp. HD1123-B1]|uniref:hypothetical protein n=1 Tax=Streptomyces huangiella TaxID=3228804 RepID=UPI003D7CA3C6
MLAPRETGQQASIGAWLEHIAVPPEVVQDHFKTVRAGEDAAMTFSWKIPPWKRHEDCTYLAVTLIDQGGGHSGSITEGVRGDDAIEALADLLMTPGSPLGPGPTHPALIGVVVRRGIDTTWLAQPPIQVARDERGRWQVAVGNATDEDVTVFSPTEISGLLSRLRSQYGRTG